MGLMASCVEAPCQGTHMYGTQMQPIVKITKYRKATVYKNHFCARHTSCYQLHGPQPGESLPVCCGASSAQ